MIARAFFAAALSVLTTASSAGAECAWVLWQQQRTRVWEQAQQKTRFQGTWLIVEAASSEAACRKRATEVNANLASKGWPKDEHGYFDVVMDERSMQIHNVCLPDTIDPRGAKGSGR
jgi:hypothetical protein